VLFGPDAALAVARGCPALRAWDIRCCQLTRRQMAALMAARPHVALMSSGKPAFIADERAFAVFEGDEVTPSRMNLRQHLDALVRGQGLGSGCGEASPGCAPAWLASAREMAHRAAGLQSPMTKSVAKCLRRVQATRGCT